MEIVIDNEEMLLKNHFVSSKIKITDHNIMSMVVSLQKNGTKEIKNEVEHFLFDHKFLIPQNIAEDNNRLMKFYMDQVLIITLIPTMMCNFRCKYCYEQRKSEKMNWDSYVKIIHFIEKEISDKNIKILKINWFGGEPLLVSQDIIKFQSNLLSKINKPIKIISSITTNGYLLDVGMYKKLYSKGIREFQITLDGTVHDKMRILKNGQGTYQKVLGNLRDICKQTSQYQGRIIVRTNIIKGTSVKPFFNEIAELFQDKRFILNIKCVRDWGNLKLPCNDILSPEECVGAVSEIAKIAEDMNIRTLKPNDKLYGNICYALYPNSFIFKSNNEIVKCSLALNNPINIVGVIGNDSVIIDDRKNQIWDISNWIRSDSPAGCMRKKILQESLV